MRVARFTSTQQLSDLSHHYTSIVKVHLPFSNQPSHFLPQAAFSMSSLTYISTHDIQPQDIMPFSRHDHPSPQHMIIQTNTVCNSQLICGPIKPNINIKSVDLFLSLSCTPHIALTMDPFVFRKIHITHFCRHHASLPYSIAGPT